MAISELASAWLAFAASAVAGRSQVTVSTKGEASALSVQEIEEDAIQIANDMTRVYAVKFVEPSDSEEVPEFEESKDLDVEDLLEEYEEMFNGRARDGEEEEEEEDDKPARGRAPRRR